jgi:hypothetical protein
MSRKELRRFLKTREERLFEKGIAFEKKRAKAEKKEEQRKQRERLKKLEKTRNKRQKEAERSRRKLEKEFFGDTAPDTVKRYKKAGVSLKEWVKWAAEAGIKAHQACAIWFSPDGAGAGIF